MTRDRDEHFNCVPVADWLELKYHCVELEARDRVRDARHLFDIVEDLCLPERVEDEVRCQLVRYLRGELGPRQAQRRREKAR
jgi:hypothetical protein